MAGHRVKYGFRLNAARDGLLVDEEKMRVVRRIFRMVGAEGLPLNAVYRPFERERIPTPGGGKRWDRSFFRLAILDDAYRPHTFEEVAARVAPEVAARLDPNALYGLWTFNRLHTRTRQVSEPEEDGGRRYRTQVMTRGRDRPKSASTCRSRTPVCRASRWTPRAAIRDNRRPSTAGRRFWELSGGILRCEVCGGGTESRSIKARSGDRYHHYYNCRRHHKHGGEYCDYRRTHRAADVEEAVWGLVSSLLRDPERLWAGLEEMIDAERAAGRGDPEAEARAWLDRIAALDRKRARLQDMAAEGHMTFEELGERLREVDAARATAERELAEVEGRRSRIDELEADRDALLERYASMVPEALDGLTGEERHQVYRMLRLRVHLHRDGGLDVEGVLREAVCTPTGTPLSTREATGRCSGA
jgi:site-specific DNA recombinase